MCLDVLRAIGREPAVIPALFAELDAAKGADSRLDSAIDELRRDLDTAAEMETRARSLTERMALTLQGSLLVRYAPAEVAEAFCASRLANRWSGAYGTLPPNLDFDAIIARAQHP